VGGTGTTLNATNIFIGAGADDTLDAQSVAAGGGLVAGAGAGSKVTSTESVRVRLQSGTSITGSSVNIQSRHDQDVDLRADAYTVALAAGTGADARTNVGTKANVDVDGGSITARSITVGAKNTVTKNRYAGSENLKSGSGSALAASAFVSQTDIGTAASPFQALINVDGGAVWRTNGSYSDPGVLRLEAYTDTRAYDKIDIIGVSGLSVTVGEVHIDTHTLAKVNTGNATFVNETGDVHLTARSEAVVNPTAKLTVATFITGVATATADSDVNTRNEVTVNGTNIRGGNVYLTTGRDSSGRIDVLATHAAADISAYSLLPSINVPTANARITEVNHVGILGSSRIEALQNSYAIAMKGVPNLAATSGSVLSLSLIPYGVDAAGSGSASSTNTVDIANTARITAGLNNQANLQVMPVARVEAALPGVTLPGDTPLQLTAAQVVALRDVIPGPKGVDTANTQYVLSALNLDAVAYDIDSGAIVHNVNAAIDGSDSTVGKFYRYRPVFEGTVSIDLSHTDFRNTTLWQQVSNPNASGSGTPVDVVESNVTDALRDVMKGKYFALMPVNVAAPTLSYKSVSNLLVQQRAQLVSWKNSHGSDPAAVARYQAQIEALDQTLIDLKLATYDLDANGNRGNLTVTRSLDAVFINMPSLYASPGSVFIEADVAPSNLATLVANKQVQARADAAVNLVNDTPFAMIVNDAIINDAKAPRRSSTSCRSTPTTSMQRPSHRHRQALCRKTSTSWATWSTRTAMSTLKTPWAAPMCPANSLARTSRSRPRAIST
jgi:hypothetical protein